MNSRDRAIVAPTPAPCDDCRDQVILGNIAWLSAHGFHIGQEFVIDPVGASGFTVGLLGEAGLTPATMRAAW
jgi:hypothetical protein